VIGQPSILGAAFGGPHRLIRKSLQPQNPRKGDACGHKQAYLKANHVRPMINRGVISEHALEMAPWPGLVTQIMLRDADQSFADQSIVRAGPIRSQSMEFLRV
jgi:hypothetical protein